MDKNLSLYRMFYEVAITGNISKASKNLYISQPAISKSIQKLEENLSTKLFIRSSRGVHLTREGEILFSHTKSAFDSLNQGEYLLEIQKKKGVGQLRIGTSTTLCKYILLPIVKNFMKIYPNIKVNITCQSTFQTIKLLEEDKIDIALAGKTEMPKNFTYNKYEAVQDTFVSTKAYLQQFGDNSTELFNTGNIMLLDEDNISRMYINQFLQTHRLIPKHLLEVSEMDLLIEFAKIGLGIACVIKEFVHKELSELSLVEIPLQETIEKREVGFSYGKNGMNQNSLDAFLGIIEKNTIL